MEVYRESLTKGRLSQSVSVYLFAVIGLFASILPAFSVADEVDDILALKSKNRDKIKRFSATYTVMTTEKSTGKTGRMKYRTMIERLSATELKSSDNLWRVETEIIGLTPMRIRVEGENVWFYQNNRWIMQDIPAKYREQLQVMSGMSFGDVSAKMKNKYSIKVLRHNNPIIGLLIFTR